VGTLLLGGMKRADDATPDRRAVVRRELRRVAPVGPDHADCSEDDSAVDESEGVVADSAQAQS